MTNLRNASTQAQFPQPGPLLFGPVRMDALEFNKIAAGLLVGLLLAFGIGKLGNTLYGPAVEHAAPEHADDMMADAEAVDETPAVEVAAVVVPIATLLAGADLANGEKQFRKCKSCHSVEAGGRDGQGPNLYGVVGAPRGGRDTFNYSDVIAGLGGIWTFEELSLYITDPKGYAPGNKMVFKGISDDEDRADLIAWLNTQSDAPLALPEADGDDTSMLEPADAGGHPVDAEATDPVLAMITGASAEDGGRVARACRACHTFTRDGANRVGPNLWNMVDRDIASVEGFDYSDALDAEGGTWTWRRLWTYLENPRLDVPGGKMGFRGIADEEDRAAVIAWMGMLADDPSPFARVE
ncbi:MAG: c-type cytochrome [bacterium]|nr:c-type cytochrome [bacterium]